MTFDVPAILDGEKNWIYDELVGYKVIYTEHYGTPFAVTAREPRPPPHPIIGKGTPFAIRDETACE